MDACLSQWRRLPVHELLGNQNVENVGTPEKFEGRERDAVNTLDAIPAPLSYSLVQGFSPRGPPVYSVGPAYISCNVVSPCEITASMKMTAFWDIAPCSLVEVDRRFVGDTSYQKTRFVNVFSSLRVTA
jgi:hypothetical protein